MTQVTGEEDEREDGDADERVRRDFAQDVAGENPHERPVKARIAWEACAKRRSLSEVVTSRNSYRLGRKASAQRAQRITEDSFSVTSDGLRLASPSRDGRRRPSPHDIFGLRGLEEQRRQRRQR